MNPWRDGAMQKISYAIEGMSCDACVKGVTNVFKKLDGVQVDHVEVGSAEVSFDPAKTSVEAIGRALTSAGYPAQAAAAE
jgi:copper chaperone CopZ